MNNDELEKPKDIVQCMIFYSMSLGFFPYDLTCVLATTTDSLYRPNEGGSMRGQKR